MPTRQRAAAALLLTASLLAMAALWRAAPLRASAMTFPRANHTATLLADGRVLVAGGGSATGAEIYDPASDSWALTGSMRFARSGHAAVRLADGRVLVAGGGGAGGAEIYDPATGRWGVTASMSGLHAAPGAALLPDGRVMVVGGVGGEAVAEIYDPATDAWLRVAPNPAGPRPAQPVVEALADGRVLVVGGGFEATTVAELYSPQTDRWAVIPLGVALSDAAAAALPGGRFLIAGSAAGGPGAQILDPARAAVSPAAPPPLALGRPTLTALPGGEVLALGISYSYPSPPRLRGMLYDPAADSWLVARGPEPARIDYSATALPGGVVLLAGGLALYGAPGALSDSALYDPAAALLDEGAYLPMLSQRYPPTPTYALYPSPAATLAPFPSPMPTLAPFPTVTPHRDAGGVEIVDIVLRDPRFPRESEEYVQIANASGAGVSLTGWQLRNATRPAVPAFVFPAFSLPPDFTAVVFSRAGDADPALGDFFWGRQDDVWRAGDRAELRDSEGDLAATFLVPAP